MLALWGVPQRPGRASNRTSDQLCRIYLAFSLGLLQPLFCLLALLLCQSSLRHAQMPSLKQLLCIAPLQVLHDWHLHECPAPT